MSPKHRLNGKTRAVRSAPRVICAFCPRVDYSHKTYLIGSTPTGSQWAWVCPSCRKLQDALKRLGGSLNGSDGRCVNATPLGYRCVLPHGHFGSCEDPRG